jgi:hypothetical protein
MVNTDSGYFANTRFGTSSVEFQNCVRFFGIVVTLPLAWKIRFLSSFEEVEALQPITYRFKDIEVALTNNQIVAGDSHEFVR